MNINNQTVIPIVMIMILLIISIPGQTQNNYSRGVVANPEIKNLYQPDGTLIKLYLKGDGVIHWFETIEGYKVLKTQNGWYTYAILDDKDNMVTSQVSVKTEQTSEKELLIQKTYFKGKNIFFSQVQIQNKEERYKTNLPRDIIVTSKTNTSNNKNIQYMLTLLVEFSDKKHIIPKQKIEDMMNKVGYNNTGSFRDYFLESSYGKLDIRNTVTNWISLPHTKAYYGKNNSNDEDANPQEFIKDALKAITNSNIDLSKFDNNNDGHIDYLQILHAGVGEESGEDSDAIWSHQWTLPYEIPLNKNIKALTYFTSPELHTNKNNQQSSIGVTCHEFAHALGLMDYYDTDFNESGGYVEGLGSWELMDSGCWNNDGKTPAHTNIYSKYLLGWICIPELNIDGEYKLYSLKENKNGYLIRTCKKDEFFIIENRQQTGFDKYIPHHGMLLYKINKSYLGWTRNQINVSPNREGLKLLKSESYHKKCPYPGEANITAITDISSPSNLKTSTLEYSYKGLIKIAEKNSTISFKYYHDNRTKHDIKFILSSQNTMLNNAQINLIRTKNINSPIPPQYSNSKGASIFRKIPSGKYTLEINKNGYKQYLKDIYIYKDTLINASIHKSYNLSIVVSSKNKKMENVNISIKGNQDSLSKYPEYITDHKGLAIFENIKPGKYIITLNKYNYHTKEETIIINGDETRNVDITPYNINDFKKKEIKIFPNPSDGIINIEIELSNKAIIQIYNTRGMKIYQEIFTGGIINTIDLSNLNTGLYKLILIDKNTRITKTLIIK